MEQGFYNTNLGVLKYCAETFRWFDAHDNVVDGVTEFNVVDPIL